MSSDVCAPHGDAGRHVICFDQLVLTVPSDRDANTPDRPSALEVLARAARKAVTGDPASAQDENQTIVLFPSVMRKGEPHHAARERALKVRWATTKKGSLKDQLVAEFTDLTKDGSIEWNVDSIFVKGNFDKSSEHAFKNKEVTVRLLVAPDQGGAQASLAKWSEFQTQPIDFAAALNNPVHIPTGFKAEFAKIPGAKLCGRMRVVDAVAARAIAHLRTAAALMEEVDVAGHLHLHFLLLCRETGILPVALASLDKKRTTPAAAVAAAAKDSGEDSDSESVLKACALLRHVVVSRVSRLGRPDEVTTLGATLDQSVRVVHHFTVPQLPAIAEATLKCACLEVDGRTIAKAELPDNAAELMGWNDSVLKKIAGPLAGAAAVTKPGASQDAANASAKAKQAALDIQGLNVPSLPAGRGDIASPFMSILGSALRGIATILAEVGERIPFLRNIVTAVEFVYGRLKSMEEMEELGGKVVVRMAALVLLLQQCSVREAIFEDDASKALLSVVYQHVGDARTVIEEHTEDRGCGMRFLTSGSSVLQLQKIHTDLTDSFTLLFQLVTIRTATIIRAHVEQRAADTKQVTDAIESQSIVLMAAVAETPAAIDAFTARLGRLGSDIADAVTNAVRGQHAELKTSLETAMRKSHEDIVSAFEGVTDAAVFKLVKAHAQSDAYLKRALKVSAEAAATIGAAIRDSQRLAAADAEATRAAIRDSQRSAAADAEATRAAIRDSHARLVEKLDRLTGDAKPKAGAVRTPPPQRQSPPPATDHSLSNAEHQCIWRPCPECGAVMPCTQDGPTAKRHPNTKLFRCPNKNCNHKEFAADPMKASAELFEKTRHGLQFAKCTHCGTLALVRRSTGKKECLVFDCPECRSCQKVAK